MQYRVLNQLTIEGRALHHNYQYFQSLNPRLAIAPVLKANAYGHGLLPIAKFVAKNLPQAPFVCVDSLYEAYELMKSGVKTDILIMGYTDPANYAVWKKLPFIFTVWDQVTLRALEKHQSGARIHLKLDTGMHRLGLTPKALPSFLRTLRQSSSLRVEGVFSHLAQANQPQSKTFTRRQLRLFLTLVQTLNDAGYHFKWRHLAATAGSSILHHPSLNLIRLGLGFYGYSPFGPHTKEGRGQRKNLLPALTLTTRIAHLTRLKAGDQVGYGGSYIAKQREVVATLPLGYHEGLSRRLSNRFVFTLADNTPCRVIGSINMNMTNIKIPRPASVRVGDPVTIISPFPGAVNSLYQHATRGGTIPYTVLTALHPSLKRIIL